MWVKVTALFTVFPKHFELCFLYFYLKSYRFSKVEFTPLNIDSKVLHKYLYHKAAILKERIKLTFFDFSLFLSSTHTVIPETNTLILLNCHYFLLFFAGFPKYSWHFLYMFIESVTYPLSTKSASSNPSCTPLSY